MSTTAEVHADPWAESTLAAMSRQLTALGSPPLHIAGVLNGITVVYAQLMACGLWEAYKARISQAVVLPAEAYGED